MTRKMNLSPERRQKLSELAKQRHAEGTWGRPEQIAAAHAAQRANAEERRRLRKKTAAHYVAEAAQLHAAEIALVFQEAIARNQPMGTRLKAAQQWLDVEQSERKIQLQEEEAEAKQHSRDELIAILADKLTAGPAAQILRRQLEAQAVVDVEVVDEDVIDGNVSA